MSAFATSKSKQLGRYLSIFLCLPGIVSVAQQKKDSVKVTELREVFVVSYKNMNGIGHFNEVQLPVIYAGKKTEVIITDSLDANKAINNTRQVLGRIPGLVIVESETGGFVANGVGIRGLNPVQSLEMNVRQNGYNVAADIYGYNETYYLPPLQAVERIEVVKGAGSIQFGAQMGGMINYVIKDGDQSKKFKYSTMQTAGSFGLFNTYHAAGGTIGKLNYFAFVNYRTLEGWRQNSEQRQFTGFGKIRYHLNKKMSLGIEYSILRNRIRMPGGLSDQQFEEDSRVSFRSRNWLKSPWNILTADFNYSINKNTFLNIKSTYLRGERSLVWYNKLPQELDLPDPQTGQYAHREVDKELMKSLATEARLVHHYAIGPIHNTVAAGFRVSIAEFERFEEAPGTNGSDFNLSATGEFEEEFEFKTFNIAPFIENCIKINDRFSITPGLRFESIESEMEAEYEVGGIEKEIEVEKERAFLLFGIGLQHIVGKSSILYANYSQAYRPVDYAQLVPLGTVSKVDPDLKDPRGWNSDLGIRGTVKNYFNYDIGVYYINYDKRIGLVLRTDENGAPYTLRTNVARSVHLGIESYMEINLLKALNANKSAGEFTIYNSFSYNNAEYKEGEFKNNRVEYAPAIINRVGLGYSLKWFSSSVQFSHQSKAFGDAANTVSSSNPLVGEIPAYSVIDWSATVRWKQVAIKAGINNLGNETYFTQRTDEYPGPGIIPSIGRSFYAGIGLNIF